jgi:hypothetical protein
MDPATIATGVLAVLTPYLVKGAKEFAGAVGDAAYEKAKGMLTTLKQRWAPDKDASTSLEQFEKKPALYKPVVETLLKEKLQSDAALAKELGELLQEMGPTLEVLQKMDEGRNVTGLDAKELNKGRVSVTQEIKNADGVTGVKIDRIG